MGLVGRELDLIDHKVPAGETKFVGQKGDDGVVNEQFGDVGAHPRTHRDGRHRTDGIIGMRKNLGQKKRVAQIANG